jgi:hypothetical protein
VDRGRWAAAELAGANGAALVEYREQVAADGGRTVEVTVTVDGVSATARATNGP